MSKPMTIILAAAALAASAPFAFADEQMNAQQVSAAPMQRVICHHDGEIIQGPNGPVICHMKPVSGVHFKSQEWFRGVGVRAAGTNN